MFSCWGGVIPNKVYNRGKKMTWSHFSDKYFGFSSGKCRIAPKTLRCLQCPQKAKHFVPNISGGGFDKNKLKKLHSAEKRQSFDYPVCSKCQENWRSDSSEKFKKFEFTFFSKKVISSLTTIPNSRGNCKLRVLISTINGRQRARKRK